MQKSVLLMAKLISMMKKEGFGYQCIIIFGEQANVGKFSVINYRKTN
jgi:hypothetical protein